MTEDQREHYEERAAIMEFDGGMPREEAEKAAMQEVICGGMMCGKAPCDKSDCTWSEAHRAKCEARLVAKWDKARRMQYYRDVRQKRGDAAAWSLANDVNAIRRELRAESAGDS